MGGGGAGRKFNSGRGDRDSESSREWGDMQI